MSVSFLQNCDPEIVAYTDTLGCAQMDPASFNSNSDPFFVQFSSEDE